MWVCADEPEAALEPEVEVVGVALAGTAKGDAIWPEGVSVC